MVTKAWAWDVLGGADPRRFHPANGVPGEIAELVVFQSCSQSAHMTGTDLAIDGGYSAS